MFRIEERKDSFNCDQPSAEFASIYFLHRTVTDERLRDAVDYLFEALTFRPPTASRSTLS